MDRRLINEPTPTLFLTTPWSLPEAKSFDDEKLQTQLELRLQLRGCGVLNSNTFLEPLPLPGSRKRPASLILSRRHKTARRFEETESLDKQPDPRASDGRGDVITKETQPNQAYSRPSSLLGRPTKMAASPQPPAQEPGGQWQEGNNLSEPTLHHEEEYDGPADGASDLDYESDDSLTSTTTTMDESIKDFFFENGRRYHRFREGLYPFPNDGIEQEREELLHVLIKSLGEGKLHQAPIGSHPQSILDVGTGTGTWVVDSECSPKPSPRTFADNLFHTSVADQYPSASVLGVDLSPIQPRWTPANATFVIDDVEALWPYQRNYFDYVHCRQAALAIRDWPKLCTQSFE